MRPVWTYVHVATPRGRDEGGGAAPGVAKGNAARQAALRSVRRVQVRARTLFRSDEALSYSPSRASSSMEMPTVILVGRIADSAIVLLVLPHEARQGRVQGGWEGRWLDRAGSARLGRG